MRGGDIIVHGRTLRLARGRIKSLGPAWNWSDPRASYRELRTPRRLVKSPLPPAQSRDARRAVGKPSGRREGDQASDRRPPRQSWTTWRATSPEWVRKPTCPAASIRSNRAPGNRIERGPPGVQEGPTTSREPARTRGRGLSLQSRSGDVEVLEHGQAACHHALIRLQHRSTMNRGIGPGAGLPPWKRLKNWLTNGLSPGRG